MENGRFWKKVIAAVITVVYVVADLLNDGSQNDNQRESE